MIRAASDDEHVLVLVLDGAKPVVEISQLGIIANSGHVAGMDEDVLKRRLEIRVIATSSNPKPASLD